MPDAPEPGFRLLENEIRAAGTGNSEAEEVTDSILSSCVADIWEMFAGKALRSPRLQYLYASRAVIDFWQKSVWRNVDFDEEVKESLGQQSKSLATLRGQITDEIKELESNLSAAGGYYVGQLAVTSALPPATGQLDPANPIYGGDARQIFRGRY